ncbi:MAG TPA: helix-turn-helix domain-containing protein [Candidatus Saccharimonadales bacterium]|nr:helix-turn-helix domain-containing protein [Candidatus Saccharimonadales bacterium]
MSRRERWEAIKASRSETPAQRAGYERARLAAELGDQVRTLRLVRGLSRGDLARLLGASEATVTRLELGGGSPTVQMLARLGEALGAELTIRLAPVEAG